MIMRPLMLTLLAGLFQTSAAPTQTPAGLWKTIDDETGQPKALVRISAHDGTYSGKIEAILDPAKANGKCDKCSDERKGKPLIGLEILRHLKAADDELTWEGGEILDPKNGKTYRARAELTANGDKLEVRGYIGLSLFGRTQTWLRME